MEVQKIIVHYLNKVEGEQRASVDCSNELLPLDESAQTLIQKLNASYRKTPITYAVFEPAQGQVFPHLFNAYLECADENAFLIFSQESTQNLRTIIETIPPAKGGFLVFSEYRDDQKKFLAVYLIRGTIGVLFKKDAQTASYKINPAEHLDLDKLAMACRINQDQYRSSAGAKYLSLMKRKLNDISLYFTNWISAIEKESSKSFTQDFYKLMNLADLPVDPAGSEIPRDAFKKNVYDLIKSAPTRAINILEISRHFYGDDNYLVELGEQNNLNIDTEFQPDEKTLKKFISIEVVSDGISLRFPRGELNTKIRFDESNEDIVIIESKKFAKDLREEVNRHEPD